MKRQILQAFQVQTAVILGLKVYIWTILKETQTTLIFLAAVFSESKVRPLHFSDIQPQTMTLQEGLEEPRNNWEDFLYT